MESKNKKAIATKAKEVVATTIIEKGEVMENVKPNEMVVEVQDIRASFGKCAIIIKDNIIFRTSTQTAEKAPLSVKELYLPNYGKMRKFVVLEDGVYELITNEAQSGTQFAQYEISEKVAIDASKINFSLDNVWNKVKKVEEAAK